MSNPNCLIEGCASDPFKRGLCSKHYTELQRKGRVGNISIERAECSVEGCDAPARSRNAAYCPKHYSRMRRHGHTDPTRPFTRTTGICPVEGCERDQEYHGMCGKHALRVERHGDPFAFTHQRDRRLARGADNRNWTGDDVTYYGMHLRVRAARGRAAEYACNECGGQAAQWSYDHEDPAERQSELGPYSVSIDHYIPRCVPCHKKHDLAVKPVRAKPIDPEMIRKLHSQGVRVRAMKKQLGVSEERINRILDELGLPRFRLGNPKNAMTEIYQQPTVGAA